MTVGQSQFLKSNWINASTLIFMIGFLVYQSRWQQSVDNRLNVLEQHTSNETMHMPFERKIKVFVPRVEIDQRLKSMESTLLRIEKKIQ